MASEPSLSSEDADWAIRLPASVSACAERWDLVVGEPLLGGLVGHVYACTTRQGQEAVLKMNPPSADAFAGTPEQEAAALRAWDGRGAVELLAFAADLRALLTVRASPGTPLPEGDERRARREVADVLSRLFEATVPPVDLPPLHLAVDRHLFRKIAVSGDARGVLEPLIEQARILAKRLATSSDERVLLHGDVMDKNLLSDHGRVVAIDPMPHVGDPHSDVGFWAATRFPVEGIEGRAAEVATMLGFDAERACQWAAIYAIGSACERWRRDTTELRNWVESPRVRELLTSQ